MDNQKIFKIADQIEYVGRSLDLYADQIKEIEGAKRAIKALERDIEIETDILHTLLSSIEDCTQETQERVVKFKIASKVKAKLELKKEINFLRARYDSLVSKHMDTQMKITAMKAEKSKHEAYLQSNSINLILEKITAQKNYLEQILGDARDLTDPEEVNE